MLFSRLTKPKKTFEANLLRYLLVAALFPTFILAVVLWQFNVSVYLSALLLVVIACVLVVCIFTFVQKSNYQLRSLTNLLIGLNEGDYSLRGIHHQNGGALAELITQMNLLTDTLSEQRFIAHESQLLLAKIIHHIDVAIIAIDEQQQIALLNPAAEALLATTESQALAKPLSYFNAQELLAIESQHIGQLSFLAQPGNYQIIRDHYHEQGQQHQLFFITNVHDMLRAHERQAWKNLIRVLSHEINNSLTPIASLASTLKSQAQKQQLDDVYGENLDIIAQRAKRLKTFIDSYRQLSALPAPQKKPTNMYQLLSGMQSLFPQRKIRVRDDFAGEVMLDSGQIEQAMINLIKNADEASSLAAQLSEQVDDLAIEITLARSGQNLIIELIDKGIGLKNTDNLFTPFYSTKKHGSGIGLLLSRQIIEAHGGYLSLHNRADKDHSATHNNLDQQNEATKISGCRVEIVLPLHHA